MVMDVVVKEGIVAGDCVLLSCGDSAQLLKVSDVDGCQIQLDGEVTSVDGEWCKVRVQLESKHGIFGRQPITTVLTTRLKTVELTDRVHVWNQLKAKSIDRVRRTGTDECEFWAPLS
ncbi:hypothetical protein Syncc9605_0556 [Synechococcus sp. CC9605]|nr:hypothetical protein Syncc9605_0556 [Synechococcus sp. CC9605]